MKEYYIRTFRQVELPSLELLVLALGCVQFRRVEEGTHHGRQAVFDLCFELNLVLENLGLATGLLVKLESVPRQEFDNFLHALKLVLVTLGALLDASGLVLL